MPNAEAILITVQILSWVGRRAEISCTIWWSLRDTKHERALQCRTVTAIAAHPRNAPATTSKIVQLVSGQYLNNSTVVSTARICDS